NTKIITGQVGQVGRVGQVGQEGQDATLPTQRVKQANEWRQPRMVFLIESDVAAAVRLPRGCRRRGHRASARVHDFGRRREEYPATARAYRGTDIDILGVHEIAFVEQPDGFGVRAPDEKAGAADPVGPARLPRHVFNGASRRLIAALLPDDEASLAKFGE